MAEKMKIKVVVKNQHLKIYVNNILHLSTVVADIKAIHSYKLSDDRWNIDLHVKEGDPIELTYTTREMWKTILKELDKLRLF